MRAKCFFFAEGLCSRLSKIPWDISIGSSKYSKGKIMAKGYLLSLYREIKDPDKLAAYAELAGPAVEAAGGKFLARGGQVEAYEAGLAERTVLIEFETYEAAKALYDSAPYQKALEALGDGVVRDFRVTEGLY